MSQSGFLGSPKVQYFDNNGNLLAGGKVWSYTGGTDTLAATYPTIADALASTNANTNPVILDSRGEASIVLSGVTKLKLYDSLDNLIWTVDNIGAAGIDVFDPNGNELLQYEYVASAVNNITLFNSVTGSPPIVSATGGDTDIALRLSTKGTGAVQLSANAPLRLMNSANTFYVGLKSPASQASNLEFTLPGADGTAGQYMTTNGAATLSFATIFTSGLMMYFGSATAPTGWLTCDGTAVSRATYAALFAVIGTTYGTGDGSTTFNLPNQARRTVVGLGGSGTATLASTIGSTGGAETHTLTIAETAAHDHILGSYPQNVTAYGSGSATAAVFLGGTGTTTSTGGGGAHNNMQPSLVLNLIIKI